MLDGLAGVGVGCGAEGACGGFDGRERGGGEHLGDGDDVAVDFAGGQLEGVAQVALDLNLGELAVLLRLAFEDRDVVAQLVAGVASHLAFVQIPCTIIKPTPCDVLLSMEGRAVCLLLVSDALLDPCGRSISTRDRRLVPGALGSGTASSTLE